MPLNPFLLPSLYRRGWKAYRYALARGAPGIDFNHFGRQLGRRLLIRGVAAGLGYVLTPVSSLRYFEFPFALACLPEQPGRCLDVSSPRLFSLYVARRFPAASIRMINPDARDISHTARIVSRLRIGNLSTERCGVETLATPGPSYDCIWSLSVVEHISGACDDRQAVKLMHDTLVDGGRLILTVPVDREFRDEYRDRDYYGLQRDSSGAGRYFFAHIYNKQAIWERLLSAIGCGPSIVQWFGETTPGRFVQYEKRWLREEHGCTVDDPREIADHYREFATWEEMPGMGVCGMMIEKSRRS